MNTRERRYERNAQKLKVIMLEAPPTIWKVAEAVIDACHELLLQERRKLPRAHKSKKIEDIRRDRQL